MISSDKFTARKHVFCNISPFVGFKKPSVMPIISLNRPFVILHGFTLIELMITLVIFTVLMALAAPTFSRFLESNRLTGAANDLIADLNLARSESIKRAANVTVCQSSNGSGCTSSITGWSSGWIVTAGSTLIRAHDALPASISMTASAHTITYQNQGQTAIGAGFYTLCNSRLSRRINIEVSAVGRYSVNQINGACS